SLDGPEPSRADDDHVGAELFREALDRAGGIAVGLAIGRPDARARERLLGFLEQVRVDLAVVPGIDRSAARMHRDHADDVDGPTEALLELDRGGQRPPTGLATVVRDQDLLHR